MPSGGMDDDGMLNTIRCCSRGPVRNGESSACCRVASPAVLTPHSR